MNDRLEDELRRKLSVLQDFGRTQPQGQEFLSMIKDVIQAAQASHKTSTLKRVARELDTLAEELFVTDSTRQYRERYWGPAPSDPDTLVTKNVKKALRDRRIRGDDQMRVTLIYLDQIATGLRENFLTDEETEQLRVLAREFETRSR